MIPLLKPSCTDKEIEAVSKVLQSGWWGMGPKCEEFEKRLADRYEKEHCVTVNSCTAALHLALLASDIGPGDEVIVPALTFISTALAVSYCGATPIFADVRPHSLCMGWKDIHCKVTPRTKAVIGVDYAGYPVALSLPSSGVVLIQDAAHSCGGTGWGDEICLSFHPVKNLATGDGGAVLTDSAEKAERMRALRWCGIDKGTWERSQKRYGWDYDIAEVGYKCHWNDIDAAIGLVQLGRLDEMNQRRREIAERYTEELGSLVRCPLDHPRHTWHLYPIRVEASHRDALIDHLLESGISAGIHYKPLTYYPMYSNQETPPVTEREWRKLVSLPIYADMTDDEQTRVIEAVKRFYGGINALRHKDAVAAT